MRCWALASQFVAAVGSLDSSAPGLCSTPPVFLQKPGVRLLRLDLPETLLSNGTARTSEHATREAAALSNGSAPSLGISTLLDQSQSFAGMLAEVSWHRWGRPRQTSKHGVLDFLGSAKLFYWGIFGMFGCAAMLLRLMVLGRLTDARWCALGFLLMLLLGLAYVALIWCEFGRDAGQTWLAGYLLELTFSVENIFVFDVIARAFKLPARLVCKSLNIVVCGQILFQMFFFMGLASRLRSFHFLGYVLGAWLIACGVSTFVEAGRPEEIDVMDTVAVRGLRSLLGRRLLPAYEKDHVFTDQYRVTLLGVATAALLIAQFALELDVVLAKIEEIPNAYMAFSSSAMAAMTLPELFFLTQLLLRRFSLLRYGIALALVFFGAELLAASALGWATPPLLACLALGGVLLLFMALSEVRRCLGMHDGGVAGLPADTDVGEVVKAAAVFDAS